MEKIPPPAPDPLRGPGRPPAPPGSAERTVDLVERARAGDAAAFDAIFRRYRPRMQRWATGHLPRGSRSLLETQDLVQEALMKTLNHVKDFQPRHEGAFQAYARTTLYNLIKDEWRRPQYPRTDLTGYEVDPRPSPIVEQVGKELRERYEAALNRLRPEEQQLVILRVEYDYSYGEIAEAVRKPSADAARMAVKRALVRIAQEMRDEHR